MKAHFGGEDLIFFQSTSPSGRRSKLQKDLEVKTEFKTKFVSAPSVNFVARPGSEDWKWRLHPLNWSSWLKLTRVVAWVVRFVANCRSLCRSLNCRVPCISRKQAYYKEELFDKANAKD